RDFHVTGVQTCALPISNGQQLPRTTFDMNLVKNTFQSNRIVEHQQASGTRHGTQRAEGSYNDEISCGTHKDLWAALLRGPWTERSEERRVGKGGDGGGG